MNTNILYPFPKITPIYPEDLRIFIKNEFIKKFGEGNLIDVKVTTYPNEYSAILLVRVKDKYYL